MIQQLTNRIQSKFNRNNLRNYLDLSNGNYKTNKKWQYTGLRIITRPYKKHALAIATGIFLSGFVLIIIPLINPVTTTPLAIKCLERFG